MGADADSCTNAERQREIQELRGLLNGVVGLLVEKRVIGGEELRVAVEAAVWV